MELSGWNLLLVFWDSAKPLESLEIGESLTEGMRKGSRRFASTVDWGGGVGGHLLAVTSILPPSGSSSNVTFVKTSFCGFQLNGLHSCYGTYISRPRFVYLPLPQDRQLPEGKKYWVSSVLKIHSSLPHFYNSEIRIAFDGMSLFNWQYLFSAVHTFFSSWYIK